MKRHEVIQNKIHSLESSFTRLNRLKETSDNRNLLKASRDLYNYVHGINVQWDVRTSPR